MRLFDRIINSKLLVRRITVCACNVTVKSEQIDGYEGEQLDLFTNYTEREQRMAAEQREEDLQLAVLKVKKKFGKNALLKSSFEG